MPHDIIDNQEQKLADHISRLLDNAPGSPQKRVFEFVSGNQCAVATDKAVKTKRKTDKFVWQIKKVAKRLGWRA